MDENFRRSPNVSDLLTVAYDTLTHIPTLGHKGDEYLVRLLLADMRFNWWYLRAQRRTQEDYEKDPQAAFLADVDLVIENTELIDRFRDCWKSWKTGSVSSGQVVEVLEDTVLELEKRLREVPNPPWEQQDT